MKRFKLFGLKVRASAFFQKLFIVNLSKIKTMRQEAILLTIGVLIITAIIGISDVTLSGKTILKQPDIVRYEGEDVYCNPYECEDACGRICSEYRNNHNAPVCSHKIYYNWRTAETWYMYYKCE